MWPSLTGKLYSFYSCVRACERAKLRVPVERCCFRGRVRNVLRGVAPRSGPVRSRAFPLAVAKPLPCFALVRCKSLLINCKSLPVGSRCFPLRSRCVPAASGFRSSRWAAWAPGPVRHACAATSRAQQQSTRALPLVVAKPLPCFTLARCKSLLIDCKSFLVASRCFSLLPAAFPLLPALFRLNIRLVLCVWVHGEAVCAS